MTTFLLRHASTSYSSRHQVNGDPSLRLPLNEEGVAACHRLRDAGTLSSARTWITSAFPRAQQTAVLLAGATQRAFRVDSRLNEIDYGDFEGGPFLDYAAWLGRHGPWKRPPGSAESQREAFTRMLTGLRDALVRPGPRVIITHGLVLSLVTWALSEAPGAAVPLFFPEAPCLEPFVIADARLHRLTARLLYDIGANRIHAQTGGDGSSRPGGMPVLATFDPLRTPPEERSPHA
ncbi:histidine phosphatase family protein [Actinacidiphila sp. bgisy145]|uniref:histidine phosphatase family protein n=1 Tax=Actinacidiphila sp. bgisy145 TaxID=3413792 RepID=UPI003EBC9794